MTNGISQFAGLKTEMAKAAGKSQNQENNSATKSKYLTVKDGQYSYTYVVIGDNFKVLIGKVPLKEDEKEQDRDSKDGSNDPLQAEAAKQNAQDAYKMANSPYQNSQDFLACQQLVADAKKAGTLQ